MFQDIFALMIKNLPLSWPQIWKMNDGKIGLAIIFPAFIFSDLAEL